MSWTSIYRIVPFLSMTKIARSVTPSVRITPYNWGHSPAGIEVRKNRKPDAFAALADHLGPGVKGRVVIEADAQQDRIILIEQLLGFVVLAPIG